MTKPRSPGLTEHFFFGNQASSPDTWRIGDTLWGQRSFFEIYAVTTVQGRRVAETMPNAQNQNIHRQVLSRDGGHRIFGHRARGSGPA